MKTTNSGRPSIPENVKKLLWLRACGRCEFRGCNQILYEDDTTKDPINEANIAHIISWTPTGPRGDPNLSPKLAKDISNLMLTCPQHNHLIDDKRNVEKYTVAFLKEMKKDHEDRMRFLTGLGNQPPKKVIELISRIHGTLPVITEAQEADALFPFYPGKDRICIDLSDVDDYELAKNLIDNKVKTCFGNVGSDDIYAAFIMALIPMGCYLGYAIGDKVNVQTYQHFRDTEDWRWKDSGEGNFLISCPDDPKPSSDVKLFINVSGTIDASLTQGDYPTYMITAENPSVSFLKTWNQVLDFRQKYRAVLDRIREDHGESVTVHLYPATPNPINFEIGKAILRLLDPTIIIYDKSGTTTTYVQAMCLHNRVVNEH